MAFGDVRLSSHQLLWFADLKVTFTRLKWNFPPSKTKLGLFDFRLTAVVVNAAAAENEVILLMKFRTRARSCHINKSIS